MTRHIDALDIASLTILAGGFALTGALYTQLPALVPVHFDAHGVPNGFATRAVGAWLLPVVGTATWALLRFAKSVVPEAWRARVAATPMSAAALILAAMLTSMHVFVLFASTHPGQPLGRALALALGAMWIALGQMMPRLRRNPLIGVRTVWTLTSDENWLRTHRVAAYTFGGAGLIAIVAGLAGGASASPVAIAAIVAGGLVPMLYSYLLARRLPRER